MLFLIAAWAALELAGTNARMLDQAGEFIYDEDVNVAPQQPETARTVSGANVLMSIYHIGELGADIVVQDGTAEQTFSQGLDIEETDVTGIDVEEQYAETLVRDAGGALALIIYAAQ